MSFAEVIRLHARHRAERPALVFRSRVISYRDLDRRVNSVCFWLQAAGIRRGDLVGVALSDTPEHLIALLALARLGGVIQPMDCRWSAAEKRSVAGHFNAACVLVEADAVIDGVRCISPDTEWFTPTNAVYRDTELTPDSPLLLSLSSGTTGMPKGPRITHRQFENRFMPYWLDMGFDASDCYVSATPLYFGGGRGFSLAMLFAGATVHLFPLPYKPEELVDYVRRESATALFLVPTLLRRLLQTPIDGLAFPSLRRLISSGSALFKEERFDIRRRLTPNLYEFYSSTEGGGVSVLNPRDFEIRPGSVGRPCFRVEVEVVDADDRVLPAGEVGRLRYRSPASPDGYFVGDSSEAFRDGWFYPGDLGSLDEQGFLFIRGRSKDMIIRGGVNIYPNDIEQVLIEAEGVLEAAVVGAPSPELGEEVVAFVVVDPIVGVSLDEAALIAHSKARLAPFKAPKTIRFVDSLPKSSAGKVLKSELVKLLG